MPSAINNKTTIINLALSHLRQTNFITAPTDASEQAIIANLHYDPVRRKVLRECDWTFCRKKAQLTLLGDVSTATNNPTVVASQDILDGYIWTYAQPAKCVALRRIYSPFYGDFPDVFVDPYRDLTKPIVFLKPADYTLGRSPVTDQEAVACNLENAWASFTFDETDESRFDDMFVEAFSLALAVKMCLPLTANAELFQLLHGAPGQPGAYDKSMEEAKRVNHQEETEKAPMNTQYIEVRNS